MVQGANAVKIGVTSDLSTRLSQLQTGSPHVLHLVYSTRVEGDAYAVEAEAHAMLDRHRVSGEWFTVPADVAVAAINGAAFRLGANPSTEDQPSPNWLKRVLMMTALFTPQWVAFGLGQPIIALPLFFIAMMAIIIVMSRTQATGGIRFVASLQWTGTLVLGMVTAIMLGVVISNMAGAEEKANTLMSTSHPSVSADNRFQWVSAVRNLKTEDGSTVLDALKFAQKMRPRKFRFGNFYETHLGNSQKITGVSIEYWIGMKISQDDAFSMGFDITEKNKILKITAEQTRDNFSMVEDLMKGRDSLLKKIDEQYNLICVDQENGNKFC